MVECTAVVKAVDFPITALGWTVTVGALGASRGEREWNPEGLGEAKRYESWGGRGQVSKSLTGTRVVIGSTGGCKDGSQVPHKPYAESSMKVHWNHSRKRNQRCRAMFAEASAPTMT